MGKGTIEQIEAVWPGKMTEKQKQEWEYYSRILGWDVYKTESTSQSHIEHVITTIRDLTERLNKTKWWHFTTKRIYKQMIESYTAKLTHLYAQTRRSKYTIGCDPVAEYPLTPDACYSRQEIYNKLEKGEISTEEAFKLLLKNKEKN